MNVEQHAEGVARLEEQLQTSGPVVITGKMSLIDGIVDPVVPMLYLRRGPEGQHVVDGEVDDPLDDRRIVCPIRHGKETGRYTELRFGGFELHHASRRIAPEQ